MFGYVKAYEPELKVKEQTLYRAIYCGLCRTMGKCTGICSRCTLSYDITFLAIVRFALTAEAPEIKKSRCLVHPFVRRPTVKPCQTLRFCSYASALLTYGKVSDDINDEKGRKKISALLARAFLKPAYNRSKKRYPQLGDEISQCLSALSVLENEKRHSLDEASALSGKMMASLFSYDLDGVPKIIAEAIGKNLGKWLYIIDAVDDYTEDLKKGRYNPLMSETGGEALTPDVLLRLKIILLNVLADAEAAFDLIDYPDGELGQMLRCITENVIYVGMLRKTDEVLLKYSDGQPIQIPDTEA